MTNLIIKGAVYYDEKNDCILVPHFTGSFKLVDCTRYLTKKQILEQYEKKFFNENKDDFKKYGGIKYYFAEYSPYNVGQWELLSDLSNLNHLDEEQDFD